MASMSGAAVGSEDPSSEPSSKRPRLSLEGGGGEGGEGGNGEGGVPQVPSSHNGDFAFGVGVAAHEAPHPHENDDNDKDNGDDNNGDATAEEGGPCVASNALRFAMVDSYGVGQHVKLPGPSAREPNVYPFGTPYQTIYDELRSKDTALYTRNGLLTMLERNIKVKKAPQRWQDMDWASADAEVQPDVALCFEERVFETLVEDMASRQQSTMRPLLVVNLDVIDSHEEAASAAPLALKLCGMLDARGEDWEESVDDVVDAFTRSTGRRLLYNVVFT
ncbi:hypothetical protein PPROV_000458100 [Pycnococcus provasolii]|uniref:RNA polymerase II subunit A C-terminal domain phosphatase SSU72 n=1 Tax=Pycnococcus provasolii TaxID=41880 RepID=A0A830HFJ2_9CHLO|nr:hypothetical protein PPROV_000458100 [Pycnococcus provasolii]